MMDRAVAACTVVVVAYCFAPKTTLAEIEDNAKIANVADTKGAERAERPARKPGGSHAYSLVQLRHGQAHNGSKWEVSMCSAPQQETWSAFTCLAIHGGTQDGKRIGGEFSEWGYRYRPLSWGPSLRASVGASLLTWLAIDFIGIPLRFVPMEANASLGVELEIPVQNTRLHWDLIARYHKGVFGLEQAYTSPDGWWISSGLGVAF